MQKDGGTEREAKTPQLRLEGVSGSRDGVAVSKNSIRRIGEAPKRLCFLCRTVVDGVSAEAKSNATKSWENCLPVQRGVILWNCRKGLRSIVLDYKGEEKAKNSNKGHPREEVQ